MERLQTETIEEYGDRGLPPPPANARKRGVAKLRKEYTLKPEFKELWERIKHKTRYAVTVDTNRLIKEVAAALDKSEIRPPRIAITKVLVQPDDEQTFTQCY